MKVRIGNIEHQEVIIEDTMKWGEKLGLKFDLEGLKTHIYSMETKGVIISAWDDTTLTGYLTAVMHAPFWEEKPLASDRWFIVNPDYQRKETATVLVTALAAWAKQQGCGAITLTPSKVSNININEMKNSLQGHGFEVYGLRMRRTI